MISTLNKRVVVVCDWKGYTKDWLFLNDKKSMNETMSHSERGKTDWYKLSRFIDNSEFVVRCSWWKRTIFIPRNVDRKTPSGYGTKTDILQLLENRQLKGKNIGAFIKRENLSRDKIEKTPDSLLEFWGSAGDVLEHSRIIFQKSDDKEYKIRKCEQYALNYLERMEFLSTKFSLNYKILPVNSFINLWMEVGRNHIDFDEIESIAYSHLWLSGLKKKIESMKSKPDVSGRTMCIKMVESQRVNFRINRGLQAIYSVLNDRRFDSYAKYFIGHFAINDTFVAQNHFNEFAEYITLSNWINEGRIKYLPTVLYK